MSRDNAVIFYIIKARQSGESFIKITLACFCYKRSLCPRNGYLQDLYQREIDKIFEIVK
jgi:hypothetical protein